MVYAIISVGGKQYRVQEGEKLTGGPAQDGRGQDLQARRPLFGDDKETELSPKSVTVTARVVGHVKGEEDPDRQVHDADRLQAPHRLPR